MKKTLFIALAIVSLASSCKKDQDPPVSDPKGTLQVNFTASFNGQPMVLNTIYNSASNYRIKPETMKYLIHHFRLRDGSGNYCEVKDAAIVDYAGSSNSFSVQLSPGTFTGVRFGLGVDSTMNLGDPNSLPASHPFSTNMANDLHWSWSTGYIFMKYEGRADTSGTLAGNMDRTFFFHPGANALYGEVGDLMIPISIVENQTTSINVDLDVYKLLVGISDTIDVKTDNGTHTSDNYPLAERFIQLARAAFSVN
ncbi:MAG: hypothetical protein K1X56_14440 [Flavobacteriales bacterium]|nr:hypothetical protein [Flavobacteriales bacterium]